MEEAGTTVTIRGIYATALTERLRDTYTVVTPSPMIRDRFGASFPRVEPDVAVGATRDRLGVGVTGDPTGVPDLAAELGAVGVDGLSWAASVPAGAVVDGLVTETRGGGAIVDLGDSEGYLPFDVVDDHVEEGEVRRVQVRDPAAPWVSRRHELDATVSVGGTVAALVRGVDALVAETPRNAEELGRTTELLDVDIPERWGVRWEQPAVDADFDELATALETVTDRAASFDRALGEPGEGPRRDEAPRVVGSPIATWWVRFGREGRFALDEDRRAIRTTLPGHHRMKATGETVSTAVDFVERLEASVAAFPFEAVTAQFGPTTGDRVRIAHGKPAGREYDLGRGTVTEWDPDEAMIRVEREMSGDGIYDALDVPKEAGDVAVTTFREGKWWYPTTYRSDDGDLRGTYLNVNTPIEVYPDAVRYVDLHVDVVKWPDGDVAVVDTDEVAAAVEAGDLSPALADRAESVADAVAAAMRSE